MVQKFFPSCHLLQGVSVDMVYEMIKKDWQKQQIDHAALLSRTFQMSILNKVENNQLPAIPLDIFAYIASFLFPYPEMIKENERFSRNVCKFFDPISKKNVSSLRVSNQQRIDNNNNNNNRTSSNSIPRGMKMKQE